MNRLWAIQCSTFIAITAWAATDPMFESMIRSRSLAVISSDVSWFRAALFLLVLAVAVVSLIGLLSRCFGGQSSLARHRSIGQLLAITTMTAVWCSLAIHHDAIAWQGKRMRFANRIDQLEAIAAPLRQDWPRHDGELARIGPFMAYPFGRPTTLVLLQTPQVASEAVYVSAIERSPDGAIKLQLTGTDGGDWAQWHPPGSVPSSFTGGLAESYKMSSATTIGDGWYLVRYQ
ncbi:hypothetical protein [Neorhodopirellula pilleata]|uniref:Uncharacterized protein n=1 Tax=Neorhodopirellula pilleata TaxID=2714738 RepID=A0A5C6AYD4_9BACT|nr:hypothetical protein [Neorhodopirellula pilleata]TWU03154.1 hypothetical protein Pla100_00720 [Neorhodopirellula pilleata]